VVIMQKHSFLFNLVFALSLFSCSQPSLDISEDTIYDDSIANLEYYLLGPGDIIEITYFFGIQPSNKDYVLQVGDILDVELFYHSEVNKRVTIMPDGKITLPRIGNTKAAGLTTGQLKERLVNSYSREFKEPNVSIFLIEFNQALNRFRDAIVSDQRGQSKLISIQPNGYMTIPQIGEDIKAAGMTLPQLKKIISSEYGKIFDNLSLSVALVQANSNLVYVSGEVQKPDSYIMVQPTTVSQIVSKAGINWDTAELSSIVVVSRTKEGKPFGRIVDLEKIFKSGNIGHDILLKRFDVVYVPNNKIDKLNVFIDQYLSNLVPDWVNTSFVYRLDNKD
jgi:polysaccharide export outer membrane protein